MRRWMAQYPELFGTQVQNDCFVAIGLFTTHSDTIPTLGTLYHAVPCAENSIRNHLRSLATSGYVSFVRVPGTDRRSIGLRIESPLKQVFDDYFALLERIGAPSDMNLGALPGEAKADLPFTGATRISA